MQFSAILAASIVAFASAKPVPQAVDYNTVDYSNNGVDYSTIDYSNDGVDYSTIDYSNDGVDYNTINYNLAAKTVTPTSTATATTAAAATTSAAVDIANAFTLITVHSGDVNTHLRPVYANNRKIQFGGKQPSSYTPPSIDSPVVNVTSFILSTSATILSLRDVVPGGQRTFVDVDGSIGYTAPHSNAIPSGATDTAFSLTAPTGPAGNQALLYNGQQGFLACPNGDGSYDVTVSGKTTRTDCSGIALLASGASNIPAAWEW